MFRAPKTPWLHPGFLLKLRRTQKEALMSTGTFTGIPPAPASSSSPNLALLILRVAVSLPVLYHGSAILFGAFGGPGPQNFAAFIRQPAVVGYLVGLAQLAGGIAILLGALQRIGSVCVILVMMGDRKSTRLNSSHVEISYAVFCLKK